MLSSNTTNGCGVMRGPYDSNVKRNMFWSLNHSFCFETATLKNPQNTSPSVVLATIATFGFPLTTGRNANSSTALSKRTLTGDFPLHCLCALACLIPAVSRTESGPCCWSHPSLSYTPSLNTFEPRFSLSTSPSTFLSRDEPSVYSSSHTSSSTSFSTERIFGSTRNIVFFKIMTIFFTIKTKFFRIKTISFTIKTISLQSCHIDSSTPKGVGDDRPIIDTRRDVSLHAGRLEHDTRLSEMDGRLDGAGRS